MAETTHKYKIGQKVTFQRKVTTETVQCSDCKGKGGYMMHSVYDSGDWCNCDKCRGKKSIEVACTPYIKTEGPFTIGDILIDKSGASYGMDHRIYLDIFYNSVRMPESRLKLYRKPKELK